MLLKKIFSVYYEKNPNSFTRKVFRIFGLKFKVTSPKFSDLLNTFERTISENHQKLKQELCEYANCELEKQKPIPYRTINGNILMLVLEYLKNVNDDDLIALKNSQVCFIVHKNILHWNLNNIKNYILMTMGSYEYILEFTLLNKNCELYKEHISRVKKKEFLWKYMNRQTIIAHSFLSYGKSYSDVYITEKILDNSFEKSSLLYQDHFQVQNSKRKYVAGIMVHSYIAGLSASDKKKVIIKLIEHIFRNYEKENGLIDGKMLDCNLCNFIINQNAQFEFIDEDYVSKHDLEKEFIVYYVLRGYDEDFYRDILNYFGLKDKYRLNNTKPTASLKEPVITKDEYLKLTKESYENLKLKYFDGLGFKEKVPDIEALL